jgi:hypothetical protein
MAGGDSKLNSPGEQGDNSGFPSGFFPLVWEEFSTLNTKPPRPAIARGEAFWMDGFIPFGPSNMRTLPGTGGNLTSFAAGVVVWFQFFNIFDTQYIVVLTTNGSLTQVDANTGMQTTIGNAGTILNPSTTIGFSQWGSQYLILAAAQENGYWLWDGTNLFTAGSFGPLVSVDNGGSNYTSNPTFTVQADTGFVSTGAFTAILENGSVQQVLVTNPGSGFTVDSIVAVTVQGGGSDNQAIADPINQAPQQTQGGVSQVIINNPGTGYTGRAFAIFTGGGGSGASASLAIQNGSITAVAIINAGQGYTSPPTIVVGDPGIPGTPAIPGGTGFSGFCNVNFGQITGITIHDGGSGYVSVPIVKIDGDGTGAIAIAQIAGGSVTNVLMQNMGHGYTRAVASFTGGNNAANITVQLMPFGVSGTTVETYQQRVWVANGAATSDTPPKNRVLYSAPQSPVDFGDGGGGFQQFDSFIRVGIHSLKQANGFLYLIADSSMNYLSNVQTASSSSSTTVATPITTFSNQNVDPQFGSPWQSSVQVFSRQIVMANTIGIFVSNGGAVEKISTPLDGFYASGPIFGQTADFSSAVASIFNIPVYMLLLPVIDTFTGVLVNKLLMWDGRRLFTTQQERNLAYIATRDLNSVLTAWGTDGTNIFELFAGPSTAFTKVAQSKLFSDPGYFMTKTSRSLSGMAQSFTLDEPITITIDNEFADGTGNAVVSVVPSPNGTWTNNGGTSGSWVNNSAQPGFFGGPGLTVFGPYPVGQSGRLTGFTIQTNASDLTMMSVMLSEQNYASNV